MTQNPPGFSFAANLQEIWWDDRISLASPGGVGSLSLYYAFLVGVAAKKPPAKNKKPTYQVNLWRWVLGRLLLKLVTFYRPQKTHTRRMYNTYRPRRASGKKISYEQLINGRLTACQLFFERANSSASKAFAIDMQDCVV
jgi:hypothetical protein